MLKFGLFKPEFRLTMQSNQPLQIQQRWLNKYYWPKGIVQADLDAQRRLDIQYQNNCPIHPVASLDDTSHSDDTTHTDTILDDTCC